MHYVVVINTDDGETDYKAYTSSADAIARHTSASNWMRSGEPVSVNKREESRVVSCTMFKAQTDNAREAVELVKAGRAEPLLPQSFLAERGSSLEDL
jgi:hypothetical protein